MPTGHLFVTLGDLLQLDCDAVLVAGEPRYGGRLGVGRTWTLPEELPREIDPEPERPFFGWVRRPEEPGRAIGVVNTVVGSGPDVVQRVLDAIPALAKTPTGRALPRIALPFVSTGRGGGIRESADLLSRLIPALEGSAREHGVDVVLVMYGKGDHGRAQYAAAQAIRRERNTSPYASWPVFKRLLTELRRGRLAVFVGAGVSSSAGVPGWAELLERLYAGLDVSKRSIDVADLRKLDPLRFADYIATLHDGGPLTPEIERAIHTDCYGLQHQLLAALPVTEWVTTNYDRLIERACADAGRPCALVPVIERDCRADDRSPRRRLLKLHGTVGHRAGDGRAQSPVLTLRDYIRYDERAGALAGALQGIMLSHHVLFLGFGMSDPHFLQLHDGVARLIPDDAAGLASLGTALMVDTDAWKVQVADRLLRGIRCHWVGEVEGAGASIAEQSRALEVFLDELVLRSDVSLKYATDEHLHAIITREADRDVVRKLVELRDRLVGASDGESAVGALLREGLTGLLGEPQRDMVASKGRNEVRRP